MRAAGVLTVCTDENEDDEDVYEVEREKKDIRWDRDWPRGCDISRRISYTVWLHTVGRLPWRWHPSNPPAVSGSCSLSDRV